LVLRGIDCQFKKGQTRDAFFHLQLLNSSDITKIQHYQLKAFETGRNIGLNVKSKIP